MRRHRADDLTAALRDLDPAPRTEPTREELDRADAAFARIVGTPHDAPAREELRRPRRRRILLAGAGTAAAACAAIPVLMLGGSNAYGSWTPTPEPLTDVAAARAADTCRAALRVGDRGEHVAVAERRGGWTYVLLAGPGTEAACLLPDRLIGKTQIDHGEFFGSYDTATTAPAGLGVDRIVENTSMEGSTDEGWFVWAEGYVGRDVTGVTVHTSSGLDIEASVDGDRFAAWWPSHEPSSDHPAETWSYTVHLADGSSRRST